jgi:hypothetical protein
LCGHNRSPSIERLSLLWNCGDKKLSNLLDNNKMFFEHTNMYRSKEIGRIRMFSEHIII